MDTELLNDIILTSQKCQRNWDLKKSISDTDLNVLINAATNCPSKQNEVYYQVDVIKNRELIKNIYNCTNGYALHGNEQKSLESEHNFKSSVKTICNSQTLANVVFAFRKDYGTTNRSLENMALNYMGKETDAYIAQRNISIGIASGYVTLVAHMLGLKTGFCSCITGPIDRYAKDCLLLLGVGYEDKNRDRLEHHLDPKIKYKTFNKKIKYNIIK